MLVLIPKYITLSSMFWYTILWQRYFSCFVYIYILCYKLAYKIYLKNIKMWGFFEFILKIGCYEKKKANTKDLIKNIMILAYVYCNTSIMSCFPPDQLLILLQPWTTLIFYLNYLIDMSAKYRSEFIKKMCIRSGIQHFFCW